MKNTIIIDWAGNICFKEKAFSDFDDAEEFLSEYLNDNYESDRGEYEIVDKAVTRQANYLDPRDIRNSRKAVK